MTFDPEDYSELPLERANELLARDDTTLITATPDGAKGARQAGLGVVYLVGRCENSDATEFLLLIGRGGTPEVTGLKVQKAFVKRNWLGRRAERVAKDDRG